MFSVDSFIDAKNSVNVIIIAIYFETGDFSMLNYMCSSAQNLHGNL